MRRVVVTGMGIVSSIGNTLDDVRASLREARSGIISAPEYAELGFRCQVHADPQLDWEAAVDRRLDPRGEGAQPAQVTQVEQPAQAEPPRQATQPTPAEQTSPAEPPSPAD